MTGKHQILGVFIFCLIVMSGPSMAADNLPKVKLQTNMGDIIIELYSDKAPNSVNNFLSYVKSGFYDGTIFHRVISNFMIQGGGFSQDYKKKDTRGPIKNEADNGLSNKQGTIAMARTSDPHSATAQFFINVVDNSFLNFRSKTSQGWGYTVFGKVIQGMDVADEMRKTPTGAGGQFRQDVPKTPIIIEKASIIEGN